MFQNPAIKRLNKIIVEAARTGEMRNSGKNFAFTRCIFQAQLRIGLERGDLDHHALAFGERFDQATIDFVQAAAE
jgi:hypothetical protein